MLICNLDLVVADKDGVVGLTLTLAAAPSDIDAATVLTSVMEGVYGSHWAVITSARGWV